MTFPDFLRSLGIIPPETYHAGRWQRAPTDLHPKKKNAAIKLNEDGISGFAIDHSSMTEAAIWRANEKTEAPKYDHAAAERRIAARRAEEAAGTARALAAYNAATPLLNAMHPYVIAKLMTMEGLLGIRVDSAGWLVVPMWRNGSIVSIQRISPEGEKRFATGAPTKGATFRMWRKSACVTILCEGLATGQTIFSAIPNSSVEVCFSAANLVAVAERAEWSGMVAVAGDNDHWTQEIHGKNPGVEAASKAAQIIGCGYAVPTCDGSDFNDFFVERLTILEKREKDKPWPASPHKLRASALMPVRMEIMRAARNVSLKTRG